MTAAPSQPKPAVDSAAVRIQPQPQRSMTMTPIYRLAILAIAAAALAACAGTGAPSQVEVKLHSTYNPDEIAYMKVPGNNTIKANIFLRQVGGDNVTCAGELVNLVGVSTYATERMTALFGSVANPRINNTVTLPEGDPRYWEDVIGQVCNSDGWATFENVADGDYYLSAIVQWGTPTGINAAWNGTAAP